MAACLVSSVLAHVFRVLRRAAGPAQPGQLPERRVSLGIGAGDGTSKRQAFPLVVVAALLAGCAGGAPGVGGVADDAAGAPLVVCPPPCLHPIDTGIRWEPSVAADPTDPLRLVASSHDQPWDATGTQRASWALAHVSTDGGETWTTTRIPGGPSAPPTHPLSKYDMMDDAMVAFLPDGTLLYSVLAMQGTTNRVASTFTGPDVVVLRSTDGGASFPDVAIVQEGGGATTFLPVGNGPTKIAADSQDKQWIAVGPDGTAFLVWSRNRAGAPACGPPPTMGECTDIMFSTSKDGLEWTRPRLLQGDGLYSGAFPIILDDGRIVVSFRDTRAREAHVAVSTDQGASWSTTVVDKTTKFPVLALTRGPAGVRIHMAYPQSDEGHDGAQVVTLRWSDDGGTTWSAPLALDTPQREGRTNPAIAATREGAVIVTFWHVGETGAELRAVSVRDGVASAPLTLDTTDGPTWETGDYDGMVSLADGSVFAVWNARHGDTFTVTGARLVAG